jgi:hypothetical protein
MTIKATFVCYQYLTVGIYITERNIVGCKQVGEWMSSGVARGIRTLGKADIPTGANLSSRRITRLLYLCMGASVHISTQVSPAHLLFEMILVIG